jgi:hypothetical protein
MEGSMMTRLANVKSLAGVTAMAAVLTAASWGVGSATAQAAPHPHPDSGKTPTAGNPDVTGKPDDTGNPDHVKGFKGLLIINSSGVPIAFIPPGTENAGRFIHILVQCHAHESRARVTDEGIHILVCH